MTNQRTSGHLLSRLIVALCVLCMSANVFGMNGQSRAERLRAKRSEHRPRKTTPQAKITKKQYTKPRVAKETPPKAQPKKQPAPKKKPAPKPEPKKAPEPKKPEIHLKRAQAENNFPILRGLSDQDLSEMGLKPDFVFNIGADEYKQAALARYVLGVAPDASAADIKKAYFRLSLTWHPDKLAAKKPELYAASEKAGKPTDRYYQLIDWSYQTLSS